jgi:hypothetical protein
MSTLVWHKLEESTYEAGVSKGVLYKPNGSGVPWNGLISMEDGTSTELEPLYFDGVKYDDVITVGDFSGVLRAYTYPDEFLECEGIIEDQTGFQLTAQGPSRFGLSYQTRIGDGISQDAGYKLHVLYNLTAVPAQKTYQTISDSPEAVEFEWQITAIPEEVGYYRPTAHVIFDSRRLDPFLLADVEAVLYGDEEREATLPTLQGLSAFVRKWERFVVVDNGDGTWTAGSGLEGVITMLDADRFQINTDTATYLSSDEYQMESSEKNEEDL